MLRKLSNYEIVEKRKGERWWEAGTGEGREAEKDGEINPRQQ